MDFGKSNESSKQVKFYTGVENFLITAVSPNKAEMEALIGREITYDPSYTDTETVKDSDGEREVRGLSQACSFAPYGLQMFCCLFLFLLSCSAYITVHVGRINIFRRR